MRRLETPVVEERESRFGGVASVEPRDRGDAEELDAELDGSGSDAAREGDVLMTAEVASTCDRERGGALLLRFMPTVGSDCDDEGEANMGATALGDRLKKKGCEKTAAKAKLKRRRVP
jgi:hypothetical protein